MNLAKNINNSFTSFSLPHLFHYDGTTAIISVSKAELFSQTFINSFTLDDLGLVLPSSLSDYLIPLVKIPLIDIFHALININSYRLDVILPFVLKKSMHPCSSCLANLGLALPSSSL